VRQARGCRSRSDPACIAPATTRASPLSSTTFSGSTALRVARERPKSPIIAISPNLSTGRKLSVVWGVHCVIAQDARDLDDVVDRACRMAVRDGFAKIGQRIIIVAGVPLRTPGATLVQGQKFELAKPAAPAASVALGAN